MIIDVYKFEFSHCVKILLVIIYNILQKQLKGGRYFPLTAVQRFDAAVSISFLFN